MTQPGGRFVRLRCRDNSHAHRRPFAAETAELKFAHRLGFRSMQWMRFDACPATADLAGPANSRESAFTFAVNLRPKRRPSASAFPPSARTTAIRSTRSKHFCASRPAPRHRSGRAHRCANGEWISRRSDRVEHQRARRQSCLLPGRKALASTARLLGTRCSLRAIMASALPSSTARRAHTTCP